MRTRTVTFGELLLRLSAPGAERLLQSPELRASFGGAEANVAVCLAHFDVDSHFITRLPDNAVGDAGLRVLRGEGVQVDAVQRGGQRLGVYFTEAGSGHRPSLVVYDRSRSALSEVEPEAFQWAHILRGAAWFHTSGITPALGERAANCTRAALAAARSAGAIVSFDLNYRSKLWGERDAWAVLRPLVEHVDVLIGNERHLRAMFDMPPAPASGRFDAEAALAVAERVATDNGVKQVAITVRHTTSQTEHGWSAVLYDRPSRRLHRGPQYALHIVDRIGGGDSFAAGLIFATLDGQSPDAALRFALAAGALKQTIPGDFNRVSAAEVRRLASGGLPEFIQR